MTLDPAVWVAIVGISGPVLMVIVTAIMRQWEKKEEHRRQDAVVNAAKQANDSLIEGQQEAARLLVQNNERVNAIGKETQKNIRVIHTLVNSEKTEAKKEALDTCKAQLALMVEVIGLKKAAGHEPTVNALAAVEALEKKIAVMTEDLVQREKQNKIAAQIMASPAEKSEGLSEMLDETVEAVSKQQ